MRAGRSAGRHAQADFTRHVLTATSRYAGQNRRHRPRRRVVARPDGDLPHAGHAYAGPSPADVAQAVRIHARARLERGGLPHSGHGVTPGLPVRSYPQRVHEPRLWRRWPRMSRGTNSRRNNADPQMPAFRISPGTCGLREISVLPVRAHGVGTLPIQADPSVVRKMPFTRSLILVWVRVTHTTGKPAPVVVISAAPSVRGPRGTRTQPGRTERIRLGTASRGTGPELGSSPNGSELAYTVYDRRPNALCEVAA